MSPGRRFLPRLATLSSILLAVALAATPAKSAVETQRIRQFENARVKVWKSIIAPNAPLSPHRHEHGRVLVALQGGTVKIVDQSGASETQTWETGRAYWLPANAPNTLHSDINSGDRPIEVMVVELLDDH